MLRTCLYLHSPHVCRAFWNILHLKISDVTFYCNFLEVAGVQLSQSVVRCMQRPGRVVTYFDDKIWSGSNTFWWHAQTAFPVQRQLSQISMQLRHIQVWISIDQLVVFLKMVWAFSVVESLSVYSRVQYKSVKRTFQRRPFFEPQQSFAFHKFTFLQTGAASCVHSGSFYANDVFHNLLFR